MGKTVHDIRVEVLTTHFGADYQAYTSGRRWRGVGAGATKSVVCGGDTVGQMTPVRLHPTRQTRG